MGSTDEVAEEAVVATSTDQDILEELQLLTRQHLLHYKLSVGRLLLDRFFDGDVDAYSRRDGARDGRFRAFLTRYRQPLSELGLSETSLRRCILAHSVVAHLPEDVVRELVFMHFVTLARLPDAEARASLATQAAEQGWTTRQLEEEVRALTGPDAPPARRPLPPGRVVTRFEKAVTGLDTLVEQWSAVRDTDWSPPQRARLRDAMQALRERLDRLEDEISEHAELPEPAPEPQEWPELGG